ncbi:hypothetical protein QFC21_004609 [Naganishia friedmannii]|uniref:Uncharacterized protein n=1 Tax=Naganishia friedmannii TaxID=89922 RepID=A0ACC2VH93_9TREE|nr:hypothetical protein QFC21_004609 [Naganishia friedmannii]
MSPLLNPMKPVQPVVAKGSYIIKFKKGVSKKQADELYSQITGAVMPRATAVLPESFAQQLNSTLQGGDHDIIEYIEPNGQVKVSPLPGNLPNEPKKD